MIGVLAAACGGARGRSGEAVLPSAAPAAEVTWRDSAPASGDDFPARPPFVAPGERMSYRLTSHGVELATFGLAAGAIEDVAGRKAIAVQTGVEAGRMMALVMDVSNAFTSWIDVATGRPLLFHADEQTSKKDVREVVDVRYHAATDAGVPISVKRGTAPAIEEVQAPSRGGLHDLNSFLVLMRSWEGDVGTRGTVDVMRGRYAWRAQVTIGAYETVVTELGDMPCVRIDGVSRKLDRTGALDAKRSERHYSIWISDDADRVPVLMVAHSDYGEIRMELVAYQPGNQPRLGRRPSRNELRAER